MLDVEQRTQKERPSSLAQWVYRVISQPGVSLRVRLRGNNLHILCESRQRLEAKTIANRLIKALKVQDEAAKFPIDPGNPVYQIIIYGRTVGRDRPDWVKQIRIKSPQSHNHTSSLDPVSADPALLVSNERLARSGSPEAIARYLSETLSFLGVSVKVTIQPHPRATAKQKSSAVSSTTPLQRLWVICTSNYSPDASLLAEPVMRQLRSLELQGFRDAVICSQVSGEATPDWKLRVDLTPAEEMLQQWACWGDVQAIARLLDRALVELDMQVRAVLKDSTLHLFCSLVTVKEGATPDKQTAVDDLVPLLEEIAPQGIQAATVYGIESKPQSEVTSPSLNPDQETPVWIEWLDLPATDEPRLSESAFSLGQQGNPQALAFLIERLINPDLDQRLATGGIQVKIRRKDDLLHIMTEAPLCPPQTQVGLPIAQFLRQLAIPKIAGVRIYGRRAGATSPAWNYGVDFVARPRLVPEATPEFAASDAYLNELVAVTGEPVLRSDLTKEDLKVGLRQVGKATTRLIQRWLCHTQVFVPLLENQDLTQASQGANTDRFSSSQGTKVAIVWGLVGLLLTFQADRLTGQWLQRTHSTTASPSQDASPIPLSLPNLSLQKGQTQDTDFNASGFTRQGDTSVVIHERADGSSTSGRSNAAKAALLAAARSPNPSFNNRLLDEKLALYQQRLLQSGPPDVLIVGSSRAMRGVDPVALQDALAAQGYPDVEIFNFGINGATAQVVDLMLRRILTPEQLPKLIIWADGARALNNGRIDATYNAIATSEGYQQLQTGTFPNDVDFNQRTGRFEKTAQATSPTDGIALPFAAWGANYKSMSDRFNQSLAKISSTYSQRDRLKSSLQQQLADVLAQTNISPEQIDPESEKTLSPEESIDFDGFLPLSIRFNPVTYYQSHPRVAGDYDGDYESFQLGGKQDTALEALLQFAKANDIDIVFANLPLTNDYLDPTRQGYEEKFQQYMRSSALQRGLIFRDLSDLLPTKYDYFSDPSHLNRYGAYEVSKQLAQDAMIPWPVKVTKN